MAYKHRDIVIAWMDGETIQYKSATHGWVDRAPFDAMASQTLPSLANDWRIKPKPVMIRHARFSSGTVCVYLKNYSKKEEELVEHAAKVPDITWLDEWHEAAFSAPKQIYITNSPSDVSSVG